MENEMTYICTNERCRKRWRSVSGKSLTHCKSCQSLLAPLQHETPPTSEEPKTISAAEATDVVVKHMSAEEASALEGFMAGYTNGFSAGYEAGFGKGYDQAMADMLRMNDDEGEQPDDAEEA